MIEVDDHGPAVVVRLRHGKVNALDLELLTEIPRVLRSLASADAVVLTGRGTSFSAGVDLRRIVDGGRDYIADFLPALSEAFLAAFDFPRPLVAAVNGHAIAGGCVLVQACDRRLMSAGTIGVTELLVGVPFPPAALEIVRHAAGTTTAELVLSGRTLSPDEALSAGLVDEVVPADDLLAAATERAIALARVPRRTYALAKEQLHRPARQRIDRDRPGDDARVLEAWADDEVRSVISAYLQQLANRRKG